MILYDVNKNECEYSLDKTIYLLNYNYKLYECDDKILKLYQKNLSPEYKMNYELFETLKSIDNPSLIKLDKLFISKNIINKIYSIGYTFNKIDVNKLKLIDYSLENLYKNISYLLDLVNELNKRNILIKDIKYSDVLVLENRIIIISPDKWEIRKEYKNINKKNKLEILNLLKSIIETELKENHSDYNSFINFYKYLLKPTFEKDNTLEELNIMSNKTYSLKSLLLNQKTL